MRQSDIQYGIGGERRLWELLRDAESHPGLDDNVRKAEEHWDSIQHPLHGLGLLEDALAKIAGLTEDVSIHLEKKAAVIFCADNGVVEEHVTQTGSYVTAIVARSMVQGTTPVGMMAQRAGADVIPIDMGIRDFSETTGVWNCRIGNGTGNILREPAMSREDCVRSILTGIDLARELKSRGYCLLAAGEMGIGNTTTASACASVLLDMDPAMVTGKGAGLSDAGLIHKCAVIRDAIQRNGYDPGSGRALKDGQDTIEVLARIGGYDIAGMCGLFLGGLIHKIPVLIDGVVSGVAALAAVRICPSCLQAMLASHVSSEPAGTLILDAIGIDPLITAQMHLGEGTGALLAMPMLDMALAVYDGCYTFEKGGVEAYKPL